MMLAHFVGVPHHAEEITIIQQLLVTVPLIARLLWVAWDARKESNMPCDTIQTATVQFGKTTQRDAMIAALTQMKLNPRVAEWDKDVVTFGVGESFNFKTGDITLRPERQVATVKRAYSAQVVLGQAKKYGWQVKETAPYEYEIIKR